MKEVVFPSSAACRRAVADLPRPLSRPGKKKAINIATDLWILALPIPQLLKLQLGLKKKVYLILMFSVGIL